VPSAAADPSTAGTEGHLATCAASRLRLRFVGASAGAGELVAFVVVTNDGPTDCAFGSDVRVDAIFDAKSRPIGITDTAALRLTNGGSAEIGLRGQDKDYNAPQDQCAATDWSTPTAWRITWAGRTLTVANLDNSSTDANYLSACNRGFSVVKTVSEWPS
jgi:hypothetical protein